MGTQQDFPSFRKVPQGFLKFPDAFVGLNKVPEVSARSIKVSEGFLTFSFTFRKVSQAVARVPKVS